MLIDSHSHIDGAEFQLDIDEVFARMKEAEVGGALVAGTSLQDYERGLNFANAHKNVWYAAASKFRSSMPVPSVLPAPQRFAGAWCMLSLQVTIISCSG